MSSPKNQPNIAIIGAGIGGVACASALAKFGIKAHIYEQTLQFSRVGAGIQMGPNATQVLHGLGLKDHLAQSAFQPKTNLNRVFPLATNPYHTPLSFLTWMPLIWPDAYPKFPRSVIVKGNWVRELPKKQRTILEFVALVVKV